MTKSNHVKNTFQLHNNFQINTISIIMYDIILLLFVFRSNLYVDVATGRSDREDTIDVTDWIILPV